MKRIPIYVALLLSGVYQEAFADDWQPMTGASRLQEFV